MPDAPPSSLPQPGDQIAGKYRVERVLGSGGFGCVLLAEHLVLRARVAIKLLLPQAAAIPGATERFLREAQAAAALRSDHVARVLDVGSTATGAPFLVMEHLVGRDLRHILRERGALPVAEATGYLLQTCEAVQEAHARGIVHRDLKPGNIFVTSRPDGTPLVKVLDFGLAKILDPARMDTPEDSITQTGLVVGSPHYMSPEQFRSLRKADTRSDIWALGVIAYEMLAGRRPFLGEGMAGVMMSVVTEEPEPLREIRPDIPPPLAALVTSCLQKSPDRRPQQISDLITALRSSLLSSDAGPRSASDSQPSGPSFQMVPGPGVLPPAPGRSTWRMIDVTPEQAAQALTTASETSKGVSVDPRDAWADVIEARRTARDRRARRKWLVAGGAVATGLVAAIAFRALTADTRAGAPAAAETAGPSSTVLAIPPTAPPALAPTPTLSAAAPPSDSPSASAPPAPQATPAAPSSSAPPTAKPAGRKPPAASPGSTDPFGKYD